MSHELEEMQALRECRDTVARLEGMQSIVWLAGAAGHDFNNLMQSIMSALQLVQKLISANRSGETEQFIRAALRAAQSAGTLNQRLMSLARAPAFAPRPVAMNELLDSAAELLHHCLPRYLQLTTVPAPDLWRTFCDPYQADVALLNLALSTLGTITHDGTIVISSRNRNIAADESVSTGIASGDYVAVEASCSGAGAGSDPRTIAPPDELGSQTPEAEHRWSFAVVRRFARLNGGDATFQSGRGAISTVMYLPRYVRADGPL